MIVMDTLALIAGASFLHSVEFYVICAVIAAAVVAAAVKPSTRNAVVTHLLASDLELDDPQSEPRLEWTVRADGAVVLTRYGVEYIGLDGAVSAAVSVNAFDVTMEERLVPGRTQQGDKVKATFVLDFLGPERYHFRYNSDTTGQMCVATLAVKPGVEMVRPLTR